VNSIVSAFNRAAVELGFRFEPSFSVQVPDGAVVKALGLVREFGSPIGTLLFSQGSEPAREESEALREMGYFCSVLFPTYEEYKRKLFMDTLDDWQFFGPEGERPTWYTGKPWS
jgi:hypothetical protein